MEAVRGALTRDFRLALVAAGILLLLSSYFALIPLAVWYSLTGSVVRAVAGCFVAAILLKPVLAPAVKAPEPLKVDRTLEPALYQFTDDLAAQVGVPPPTSVRLDCEVNAWTGRSGQNYTLTLGLPLVRGLNQRELAGVLAHELAHTAQTSESGLARFVRSIDRWLRRAAKEEDEWDVRLLQRFPAAGPVVRSSRIAVGLFYFLGRVVDAPTLRRWEYEADREQIRVAGSAAFRKAVEQFLLLETASHRAIVEVSSLWRQRRLPDDFPHLVRTIRDSYGENFRKQVLAGIEEQRTGFTSVHPSEKDRLARADRDQPGVYFEDAPAETLFTDIDPLSRSATVRYYEHDLGLVF